MSDDEATPFLAIDLCLGACTAAAGRGEDAVRFSDPMARGHQERLAPLVDEALRAAGLRPCDLRRIGVTTGPGSFTGLRVGLAFAKSLASATGAECVGFSSLEALRATAPAAPGATAAVIASRGDDYFCQIFIDGEATGAPDLLTPEILMARLVETAPAGPWRLIGPAAARLGERLPGLAALEIAAPSPEALIALTRKARALPTRPRPLYLRAPDARTLAERALAE